jgi:hypothetical protein
MLAAMLSYMASEDPKKNKKYKNYRDQMVDTGKSVTERGNG